MLEQMGGIGGLVYSSVPVLVFVLVNSLTSLQPAIWSSIGSAVVIVAIRLARKESLQPAISGFFGVAVAAFIAYRTGSAKGFFLFGIYASLIYGGAFLLSIVVRWPLAGTVWSFLNGTGTAWRRDKFARLGYDLATLTWALVFGARFVVQRWLYDSNQVGWLAFAKIAMGYPLMAVALLVTVWAVRRADRRLQSLEETAEAENRAAEARFSTAPAAELPEAR
ncbi:DUF3159 domain-containing protein [Solihabitans fulvus]|uniref:DUF3159 domain-containing protein n=1 Tax=Solihabitans fulvus TaxID=1892852 RepID=A0A5B2WX10_9PSEU|nr:DUF3159 domain-containing protein [Solihabitans fulvus]KAA2254986.1 DUF3159 domain-containing protein [Solihabitans fulvus]